MMQFAVLRAVRSDVYNCITATRTSALPDAVQGVEYNIITIITSIIIIIVIGIVYDA